jgi:hypothetical protein
MTVDDWIFQMQDEGKMLSIERAFEAGVQEGLRRAAEKEARKRPTGLVFLEEELKPRDSED